MWKYQDIPFVYDQDCIQYNREKMDEHAQQMIQQYNINKRFSK